MRREAPFYLMTGKMNQEKSVTKTAASSPYAISRVPNVNVRPYGARTAGDINLYAPCILYIGQTYRYSTDRHHASYI